MGDSVKLRLDGTSAATMREGDLLGERGGSSPTLSAGSSSSWTTQMEGAGGSGTCVPT